MPRYWVIAPYEWKQREEWQRVWEYDLANEVITVGWGLDEDPAPYDRTTLRRLLREVYSDRTEKSIDAILRILWSFYHDIAVGDVVIARRGLKMIAAIGTVTRAAWYDPERAAKMPVNAGENFLGVAWRVTPRDFDLGRVVFGQPTLQPMAEDKFFSLLRTIEGEDAWSDVDESAFPEGREVYRQHRARERNQEVVSAAKTRRRRTDPLLRCDICGFSFAEAYGALGEGFIEAHHTAPLSECAGEVETKVADIALVCSNCHRMLHRRRPWLRMSELTRLRKGVRHEGDSDGQQARAADRGLREQARSGLRR